MLFRRSSATASLRKLALLGTLMVSCGFGSAQDQSQAPASTPPQPDTGTAQQPATSGTGQPQASEPAPAFGQDNSSTPPTPVENPPISSLDQPSLEAPILGRSYLVPAVQANQSLDSNAGNAVGRTSLTGVTRGLGSLALQKIWSRSDTEISYIGGGAFYTGRGTSFTQIHDLQGQERYLWRTGQVSVRDTFTYLPEGTFGYGSYGGGSNYLGLGSAGGVGGGVTGGVGGTQFNFFGPGQFASIGQQPRITNLVLGDVVQALNPRSSVTAAAAYGVVRFTGANLGFVDSSQVSAQVGYNYQIARKDQIGVVYGYQNFRYPSSAASNFNTDVFNVLYGHRISGRMDLIAGGGPQITNIDNPLFGSFRRIGFTARGELRYRFPKTFLSFYYNRYNTSGSGIFTGATSDIARATVSRPIHRIYGAIFDGGYSRNSRIVPNLFSVAAKTYAYWYAGGSLHRNFGRYFSGFVSYQYDRLGFDQSFCTPSGNTGCNRTSQRHDVAVGVTWHPRPIRLD